MLCLLFCAIMFALMSTCGSIVDAAEFSSTKRYVHFVERRPTLGAPASHVEISFCVDSGNSTLIEMLLAPGMQSLNPHALAVKCGYRWFSRHALQVFSRESVSANNKGSFLISLQLPAAEYHRLWLDHGDGLRQQCKVILQGENLKMNSASTCNSRFHRRPRPGDKIIDSSQQRKEEVLALIKKASPVQMTQVLAFLRQLAHMILMHESKGATQLHRRRTLLSSQSTKSLLEILSSMDEAGALGVGIRMKTVYENIVNPITNAVAEQLPTIIFTLTKFPIAIQMRDSLTESLKDMMTAPTLANLDPAGPGAPPPSLLEMSTTAKERTSGLSSPIESASEGLGNMIAMDTADAISTELSDALWKSLKDKLEDSISNAVSRQTVRSLNTILTGALSHTISRMAIELASISLTRSIAKLTNKAIIAALTSSVSMTVTHALTRKPKSDYYCHYCMTHNLYCDTCRGITADEYKQDHYISYYSEYYAKYYSYYYGGAFADAAVDEYLIRGKRMQN